MSKGSGRRRITPSDGLHYDEDTMMTNIEERGGSHHQSAKKELRLGIRTGARPTAQSHYGNHGRRWGGKGRKDDFRNWKSHTKGKQYEHNERAREAQEHHRPVPDSVAANLREKSIASDVARGYPCKMWAAQGKFRFTTEGRALQALSNEKFLVKFGGDIYKGTAARMARPYSYSYNSSYSYKAPPSPSIWKNPEPPLMKIGFAVFEGKVQNLLDNIRYRLINEFGNPTH